MYGPVVGHYGLFDQKLSSQEVPLPLSVFAHLEIAILMTSKIHYMHIVGKYMLPSVFGVYD